LASEPAILASGKALFARARQAPAVQALARRVEQGGAFACAGIAGSAQAFVAAWLRMDFPGRPILVVTEGPRTQENFQQDLETWLGFAAATGEEANSAQPPRPLFYPAWEVLPHEGRLPHADVVSERLQTLVALGETGAEPRPILVASVAALLQKTFPRTVLAERTRLLKRGDHCDPLDLIEWLEVQGYEPEAQVTQKGELAMRGGVVDVWPPPCRWPVRLEFFGDELESLREFDPQTQISRAGINQVVIAPAGEVGLLSAEVDRGEPATALATLLDHLPAETILLLCEPEDLRVRADEYTAQVPATDPFRIGWDEFLAAAEARGLTRLELTEAGEVQASGAEAGVLFQSLEAFRPVLEKAPDAQVIETQRRAFFEQMHRWLRQGFGVHVVCNNDGERQRFGEIWEELLPPDAASATVALRPTTHLGALGRGFLCDAAKLVVITDAEIFGRYKVQRPRRLKSPHAAATRSLLDIDFSDLEEGDLVVHLQYGIGRYAGLKALPPSSGRHALRHAAPGLRSSAPEAAEECLVIEYAAGDPDQPPPKLYVPVSEAHLVSKYIGAGKARPPLNTLGGTRWAKAKSQAQDAVQDIAAELLALQAARDSQAGHAFKPDTPWQREFEASFLFEETPDQWKAILETKGDMEKPRPMDRLICGDVGYGKTEVAIRAAFKAVMDGRQVAVLVPTTVLAQQHFNTFRERMADYPVRVELLSRFRTPKEQRRVLRELNDGSVDIVIGTHRLVQDDVSFKDLGLVIVDEEQRFGVLHKEKLKLLRRLVDVLTLTATPIPRTLYLALSGARDMSTIETPPHDRLPIETVVCNYDERLIRDAIQRELNRGGQVFFLHNRVMTIQTMTDRVRALVPHARIVVGHGQMDSDGLEEVMTAFINGEADVLLSTTIIESGIDIPNANTIIIDRADRFGLSELYQLRGRVGRYKHQAYAYLMLPRHARLLTDVRKRMSAIKQYSTLGSGFKVAMRDLEIRGAGNLLGAEQSGHITAVGFELYCQLLKQSVAALKGEKVPARVEVSMRLDFLGLGSPEQASLAVLPTKYISDSRQRIEVYRKLAQAQNRAEVEGLRQELRDRFGPLPEAVDLLLLVGELKALAAEKGITAVEVKEDKLMLSRGTELIQVGGRFPRLTKKSAKARLMEARRLVESLG
jgi:transcription-repair coupling factor (superfamily II helicase)